LRSCRAARRGPAFSSIQKRTKTIEKAGTTYGGGEVDHDLEALIGFAGTHGDAFELFEFAEEIFEEVAQCVDGGVDLEFLRVGGMLRDHDAGAILPA